MSPFKRKRGIDRLVGAARSSTVGFKAAWQHEAAFRQEVVIGLPLILVALVLPANRWQTLLLVSSILLVWLAELVNSAIEALADAVSLAPHPLLGRAKELGSAAVMTSLLLACASWFAVFWP